MSETTDTRAVILDLIEKAKAVSDTYCLGAYSTARIKAVKAWLRATRHSALLPILALALKGLDADQERAKLYETTATWLEGR